MRNVYFRSRWVVLGTISIMLMAGELMSVQS